MSPTYLRNKRERLHVRAMAGVVARERTVRAAPAKAMWRAAA